MSQHVCSIETCLFVNRDGLIICKLTGRCKKQFICANEYKIETTDLFTKVTSHCNEYKSTKRNENKTFFGIEDIKKEVERYVRLLLYSSIRNDISTDEKHPKKKQKRHYKKRRKIQILVFNQEIFTDICTDVSLTIHDLTRHNKTTKLKPLIVSLLFLKQHGKEYKTKTQNKFIIKRSEYLYQHLPSISDLHLFSVQKNMIRIGSNIIQKIIRNI